MKNAALFAIAGLFAASISSAALAQAAIGGDANVGVGANANVGAGNGANVGAGVDTDVVAGANARVGNNAENTTNYGEVISSLRTSGDASAQIDAFDKTATVDIITLSELRGEAAENAQALDQALTHQEEQVDDIRSAIEANATLSGALEAEGYTAEDVVAVSTSAGGEVTLIVGG